MNSQAKEILQATNKCILITSTNSDVLVNPCTYCLEGNRIIILFDSYNAAINNLSNNNQATVYVTVCDNTNIYYLIIEGTANVSSTSFCPPSVNNSSNNYQVNIRIDNTTCYYEQRM